MPRAYATAGAGLLVSMSGRWLVERIGGARRTDIPALREKHARKEDEQAEAGADPAVEDIGRRLVEERLVLLQATIVSTTEGHKVAECGVAPSRRNTGTTTATTKKEEKRTLPNLFVCAVTVLKGVVCSSGASIVKGDPRRGG